MHDQPTPLLIDATGTVRRLQGLVAIGHTQAALARRLRWSQENLARVITGELARVTPAIADAVKMLFLELWAHPVLTESGERVKEIARRRGWLSPLAWDDIDDPAELPNLAGKTLRPASPFDPDGPTIDRIVVDRAVKGLPSKVTAAERRLVVVRLHRMGWDDNRIARATCVTHLIIRSDRRVLGLEETPVVVQERVSA